MTRPRFDEHSTEFGLWLRKQNELDSRLGFTATNLDYVWHNYKTGDWMLIEEKRFGGGPTYSQTSIFNLIDTACKSDPRYKGLHLLVFRNSSPEDGPVWLDGKKIDADDLIHFLRFEIEKAVAL